MKLFTRITKISETENGLQQGNISVYLYESEEVAWTHFQDFISDDQWEQQLNNTEGFYKLELPDGSTNTIFLETRFTESN